MSNGDDAASGDEERRRGKRKMEEEKREVSRTMGDCRLAVGALMQMASAYSPLTAVTVGPFHSWFVLRSAITGAHRQPRPRPATRPVQVLDLHPFEPQVVRDQCFQPTVYRTIS